MDITVKIAGKSIIQKPGCMPATFSGTEPILNVWQNTTINTKKIPIAWKMALSFPDNFAARTVPSIAFIILIKERIASRYKKVKNIHKGIIPVYIKVQNTVCLATLSHTGSKIFPNGVT